MSKKTSPTVIGGFVIGAVGLIIIAVLLFGGAEIFANKSRVVSYFPGSVKGLRVGSNVTFRGVRIGYVENIQLLADVNTLETTIEVTMEILPDTFRFTRDGKLLAEGTRTSMSDQEVIDAGLRAKLDLESFVTGQLLVDLDLHPEIPPLYRAEAPPFAEIPTIPSNIEQLLTGVQTFIADIQENFDVKEAVLDLQDILEGVDELVNSPDVTESLAGLNRIINDPDTQELTGSLLVTIEEARSALQDTRKLVNDADAQIEPLVDSLMPVIDRLDSALAAGEEALESATEQMQGDTELAYELTSTLSELQGAARSLRLFLDFLERNPDALIRGKQGP